MPGSVVTYSDIMMMNVFGDLEDLESALNKDQHTMPNKVKGRVSRCLGATSKKVGSFEWCTTDN